MKVFLVLVVPFTTSAAEWGIATPRDFIKAAQEAIAAPDSPQAKPIPSGSAHGPGISFAVIDGQPLDTGDSLAQTTVAIIINPGSDDAQTCTGTIIAKDLVLTAAHCMLAPPSYMMIHLGPDAKQPIAKLRVRDYRVFPGSKTMFTLERAKHDMALVRFAGTLPPGFHEADIDVDPRELRTGALVEIVGFGNRHIGIKSMGSLLQTTLALTYIDEGCILVLADPARGNHGTCDGDSGGPAAIRTAQGLKVIGVASIAPRGCGPGEYLLPDLGSIPFSAAYTMISAPENAGFIRTAANDLRIRSLDTGP